MIQIDKSEKRMVATKKILNYIAIYMVCLGVSTAGMYGYYALYGQKTLHLEKKQWHPAEPETQNIDKYRLTKALEYIDKRLPTARSLLLLRNGKTVVEKYYWRSGPEQTDYLHSLNLPLLQLLVGIAIDHQLIEGPEQPLDTFFHEHLPQSLSDGTASLTLTHLLWANAPLMWGTGNPDYWDLFYAKDRIEASLRVISRHRAASQPAVNFAAAHLLSQVIEKVTGRSVFDFASHYLFQPLGITTYAADDNLPRDSMVGFQIKALDLAKIGYLLAREGAWEGRQIVSPKWVRWLFLKAPLAEIDNIPGGSWVRTKIRGHESLVAKGDGGQNLVLIPALHVVMVKTSTSRFALPHENGHDRLMQLIVAAVLERIDKVKIAVKSGLKTETKSAQSIDTLLPNYVFSIPVPQDILNFFDQFAGAIASRDHRRIAASYARAYEYSRNFFGGDIFETPYPLMFRPAPPNLEFVHITKIRIEKNRAYLRGQMKLDYININLGLDGIWPLENLIKLKGRWRWLGLPKKTAILDLDDYFDAELSEAQQRFVNDCSGPLVGASPLFATDCFAEDFQLAGGGKELWVERLKPFLDEHSGGDLHVTGIQQNGAAYRVQGYIEGSSLGELSLPNNLYMVKENGAWKWQGSVDSKQAD